MNPAGTNKKNTVVSSMSINMYTNAGENRYKPVLDIKPSVSGYAVNVSEDLVFTSSNTKVAVVSKDGVISAIGNGKATITIKPVKGNSASAKITVNATTKVTDLLVSAGDDISILANGSKNPLRASVNYNASNKKISYKILSVKYKGEAVTSRNYKNFILVDNKGNVVAKKTCEAVIRVSAGKSGLDYHEKTVNVTAVVPVTSITFANGKTSGNSTVYIENPVDDVHASYFEGLIVKGAGGETPAKSEIVYSSSNTNVAEINENGVAIFKSSGKVTLTATAADGSKKKATQTVNVVVDAYELNVKGVDEENHLLVEADKKIKVSTLVSASVNSNATNKKIVYSPSEIKLKAGETKTVTISSADKRSNTAKTPVKVEITLEGIAKTNIATEFSLVASNVSNNSLSLKKGKTFDVVVEPVAVNPDQTILQKVITWSSSNTKVATVDSKGHIVTKACGTTTITAAYDAKHKYSAKLNVTKTDEEYVKSIVSVMTKYLKAKGNWATGAQTIYDAVNDDLYIEIINKDVLIADSEDCALADAFDNLPSSVTCVSIARNEYKIYISEDQNGNWKVYDDAGTEMCCNDTVEMLSDVKNLLYQNSDSCKSLVGQNYSVEFVGAEADSAYTFTVEADARYSTDLYEKEKDTALSNAIKNYKTVFKLGEYDTANNTVNVSVANDNDSLLSFVEALKERLAESMEEESEFSDIWDSGFDCRIMLTVEDTQGNIVYTANISSDEVKVNSDYRIDLNTYCGSNIPFTVKLKITTKYGAKDCDYLATFDFNATDGYYDAAIDEEISNLISNSAGISVAYTGETNNFVYTFAGVTSTLEAFYSDADLDVLIKAITSKYDIEKIVIKDIAGGTSTVSVEKVEAAGGLLKLATGNKPNNKISTIVGKTATVIVDLENGKRLSYTFSFERVQYEAKLDPATGKPYDLGGITVKERRYWKTDPREENPTGYLAALYEYQDWLQKTYNFKYEYVTDGSDWGSIVTDFISYVENGDDNYYIWCERECDEFLSALEDDYAYDLSTLDCLDFSDDKYNYSKNHILYNMHGKTYAMSAGVCQARTGVIFNKTVLQKAGIDPNSIYELQANDQWTWEEFEKLLKKVKEAELKTASGTDIHALCLNEGVGVTAAVFSNGGAYVGKDSKGDYTYELESEKTLEALNWITGIFDDYDWAPADVSWDYYQTEFKAGEAAFLIDESYMLNSGNALYEMEDDLGFVMFPKGPKGSLVQVASEYPMVIPSCYSKDKAWKIAFAYDLWNEPPVGYEDYNGIIENNKSDPNAKMGSQELETIELMTKNTTVAYHSVIKSFNVGPNFLWHIMPGGDSIENIVADARDTFNKAINAANGNIYEAKIDPSTGKPYDLGGITVVMRDWWSNGEPYSSKTSGLTGYEKAYSKYIEWLQETYNFTFVRGLLDENSGENVDDWGGISTTFTDYTAGGGDDNYYLFTLHPEDTVVEAMRSGLARDLSTVSSIHLEDSKYAKTKVSDLYTIDGIVCAMSADDVEPRTGLFFNKALLSAAGVDVNTIYDMQESDSWTWEEFEKILKKVDDAKLTASVGGKSVAVHTLELNEATGTTAAVFSNGGQYVGLNAQGKYTYEVESENTLEALNWIKGIYDKYDYEADGAVWDAYKSHFADGITAFMVEDMYVAESGCFAYDMSDPIGFVMFPKGPKGMLTNVVYSNIVIIPNCYNEQKAWTLGFVYDLITEKPAGYEDYDLAISPALEDSKFALNNLDDIGTLNLMKERTSVGYHTVIPGLDLGANLIWKIYPNGDSVENVLKDGRKAMNNAIKTANGENPADDKYTAKIDPATGKPYDLGGITIKVRRYWEEGEREENPTGYTAALYEYQDWAQQTYNFKYEYVTDKSTWGSIVTDFGNYVKNGGDDTYYIFSLLNDDSLTEYIRSGYAYDLSSLSCLDFSQAKYTKSTVSNLYTIKGKVYAMNASEPEARTGIYFNKRILTQAGIDTDTIYAMQDKGTWTWEAFETMLKTVDDAGLATTKRNIIPLTLNESVGTKAAIFSNGGRIVSQDKDGNYTSTLESEATKEALKWIKSVYDKYDVEDEEEAWDGYKTHFINGEAAFLIDEKYAGMNGNYLSGMEDEIGFVMFPKGPKGSLVQVADEPPMAIPSCYSADKAWKIAFAYDVMNEKPLDYEDYSYADDTSRFNNSKFGTKDIVTIKMMTQRSVADYSRVILNSGLSAGLYWKVSPNGEDIDDIISDYRDTLAAAITEANK